MKYLNTFLENQKTIKQRKKRTDKKKDVRVWVDDITYRKILERSKLQGKTITQYCSDVVSKELNNTNWFRKFPYQVEMNIVHVKLNQEEFEKVCSHSAEWGCHSIRETVHRILYNSFETEGLI